MFTILILEECKMRKEKQKDASTDLLQELYYTAQMGLEATQIVMPKVKDEKHETRHPPTRQQL